MNGGLCFLGPDYKTKNKKRRSVVPKESYMNINTGSTTVTKKKKRHQLLHTGNSTADSDIKKNSCHVLIPEYLFFLCTSQVRAANAGSGQQQLRVRRVHRICLVYSERPQTTHTRYHALDELLGFHLSFGELVKRKTKLWCSVYALLWYSK